MPVDSHHPPRHVEQIIEQQVRRWELQRKARAQQAAADREVEQIWPVVTVSREFGSQGAAIGKKVADALGFGFWDQELVHEVADRAGAREALMASLDERVRSRIDDFIAHVFRGGMGASDEYVRHVSQVIHTIERHGAAVIIGRGSQFVVDSEQALRVRFVAPREDRVRGYAERGEVSLAEAARVVDTTDRDRQTFFRQHFRRDVGDPLHYDMVVNLAELDMPQAVQVVVAAYRAKFGRVRE